jgi:hypothetical protein
MVLFVDLDDDDDDEYSTVNHDRAIHTAGLQKLRLEDPASETQRTHKYGDGEQDKHLRYNAFSAALSCYP